MPMVRKTRPPKSRGGSTLIDIVVTILIIGILAASAAPRFSNSLNFFRLNMAAERLAADLKYAGTLARVSGKEVRIDFKAGTRPDESLRPGQRYHLVYRDPS